MYGVSMMVHITLAQITCEKARVYYSKNIILKKDFNSLCSHCLSVTKEKIQKICVGTLRFTMAAFGNLGPKSI